MFGVMNATEFVPHGRRNHASQELHLETMRRMLHLQRMENDFLRREVEMLREELKKHGQYPFPPSSWDVYCNQDSNEAQP